MIEMFQQTGDTAEAAVGMFGSKIRGRAKDFFGISAQAEQGMYRNRQITGDMMKRSIQAFGMKSLMQGDQFFEKAMKDMQQQLREARDEAIRARQQGNMDSYRRAMQRKMELQRLAQQLESAKQSGIGNVLIGIGTAFASVLGLIIGTAVGGPAGGIAGAGGAAALSQGIFDVSQSQGGAPYG